jgi:hypothetical protein
MKAPDLVVGEVGFGQDFGQSAELEFLRNEDRRNQAEIEDLRKENRALIRSNNRLVRVLGRCIKPDNHIASESYEAVQEALGLREGYEL